MTTSIYNPRKGFTLAELLIALAILGVIATFTIPKLLTVVSSQNLNMILKEDVSTLNTLVINGVNSGQLTQSTVTNYMTTNINATLICNSNSSSQGCWSGGTVNDYWSQYESRSKDQDPGVILPNGTVIIGFYNINRSTNENLIAVIIDANGSSLPNQPGVDQLAVYYCIGPNSCTTDWGPFALPVGKMFVGSDSIIGSSGGVNQTLFDSLWVK